MINYNYLVWNVATQACNINQLGAVAAQGYILYSTSTCPYADRATGCETVYFKDGQCLCECSQQLALLPWLTRFASQ